MGSLPKMGGPMIGEKYCLSHVARYMLKHSAGKTTLPNKWDEKFSYVDRWDVCDEHDVVIFRATKYKPNADASNSSWTFKYITHLEDAEGKLVTRFMFKGSKWEVFNGESDDIVCVVKEHKGDLQVFLSSNLKETIPDYRLHVGAAWFNPCDYVIVHGKEPLAEVLKNDSWYHLQQYIMGLNEGADVAFVSLLTLMMDDMATMFGAINATAGSFFNYNYRSSDPNL